LSERRAIYSIARVGVLLAETGYVVAIYGRPIKTVRSVRHPAKERPRETVHHTIHHERESENGQGETEHADRHVGDAELARDRRDLALSIRALTCKARPGISPVQDVNSVILLFNDLADQPIVLDLGSEQSELSGEI
jgi:hypothetical protein